MLKIFCFTCLMAVNYAYASEKVFGDFIVTFERLQSKCYSEESFGECYSHEFIEGNSEFFKRQCGFKCVFLGSEIWKESHNKSLVYDAYISQSFNLIEGYEVGNVGDGRYILYVLFKTIWGADEHREYTVSYHDSKLKIDHINMVSGFDVALNRVSILLYDEGVKQCLLGDNSNKKDEDILRQQRCFIKVP